MTQQSEPKQYNYSLLDGRIPSEPNSAKDAFDALMISLKSFIAEGEVKATPMKSRRTLLGSGSSIMCFLNSLGKEPPSVSDDRSVLFDGDYDPVLPPELIKSHSTQFYRRTRSSGG